MIPLQPIRFSSLSFWQYRPRDGSDRARLAIFLENDQYGNDLEKYGGLLPKQKDDPKDRDVLTIETDRDGKGLLIGRYVSMAATPFELSPYSKNNPDFVNTLKALFGALQEKRKRVFEILNGEDRSQFTPTWAQSKGEPVYSVGISFFEHRKDFARHLDDLQKVLETLVGPVK